ncbi:phage tail assembly chaperone [Pantoea ananatis]|uniref:phage tail assembly chaperone n=1 Tax=Pantoea ananas TaxID=553 RepID=UPI0037491C42
MQFEIKGIRYSAHKLSVFDQLKVSRKLLPVLAGLLAEFGSIQNLLPKSEPVLSADTEKVSDFTRYAPVFEKLLPVVADKLAMLSEEDTNAIIFPCLAVVQRAHGKDRWVPVAQGNDLAFDDIDLFSMLQIVGRVVGDSLGNFLPALPGSVTEGQQPQG